MDVVVRMSLIVLFSVCEFSVSWSLAVLVGVFWSVLFVWRDSTPNVFCISSNHVYLISFNVSQ